MNKKVLLSFLIISFILTNSVFAASSYYVGSAKSDVYHYPSCYWAGEIYPSNLISFDTPEDANDAGYRPCKVCNPPLPSFIPNPTLEDSNSDKDELKNNFEIYTNGTYSLDYDTEVKNSKDYSIRDYSNYPQKNSADDVEPTSTYGSIFKQLKNYTEDFEPVIALKILLKLILIIGLVKYFKVK